jgi:Domain of unknown function (DUF6089)
MKSTLSALITVALLSSGAKTLSAQYRTDFGFSVGAANYLGDIGGDILTRRDFVSDMKVNQTRTSFGVFARQRVNSWLSIKGTFSWSRLSGDDRYSSNPARNTRNLSFRNDILELSAIGQLNIIQINDLGRTFRHKDNFRAYIGAGAGLIYHNPKTFYQGVYIPLRPLQTENISYSKFTAIIPVSGGFTFTLDKRYKIGFDLCWRTTFTDYLDDISTRYADPSTMVSPLAADLSNRTDELDNIPSAFAENFTPGNKRGDSSHNDSYLTSTVEFSYALRGRSVTDKPLYPWIKQRPSKYDGPGKVRYKVRKVRPKW